MKKLILYSIEFIISKRLHIGILAYVNAIYFMRFIPETANSFNPLVPLISFFIVWSAYLENLTTDIEEDKLNKAPHGIFPEIENTLYPIERFYPFFYLAALLLALRLNLKCFWLTLLTIVIWSSYVHKWLPVGGSKRKRLKEFYIIKNLIPPLGWVFSAVLIPFATLGAWFAPEYSFLILVGVFSSFREEIKFDIPDMEGDKASGINTLPNTLGEAGTKKVLAVINYISILMLFLMLVFLYKNQHILRFEYSLMNLLPLLTVFAYDQGFNDKLFEKKEKEYCNIGIIWWIFLMSVFLILSYPYNIFVFLSLRLVGNLLLVRIFSWSNIYSKVQERS